LPDTWLTSVKIILNGGKLGGSIGLKSTAIGKLQYIENLKLAYFQ